MEWIKVEESLPRVGEEVLCKADSGYGETYIFVGELNQRGEWEDTLEGDHHDVIAWARIEVV